VLVVSGFAIGEGHEFDGVPSLEELGRRASKLDLAIVGMCSKTDDAHYRVCHIERGAGACPVHNGCRGLLQGVQYVIERSPFQPVRTDLPGMLTAC
jgi:hypothetical protein